MHGRIKVRSTEEEKARKEKERQEKLKVFQYAMKKIQAKRKSQDHDKEMLELTGKVLCSNPDIYTLWNIRRETLQLFLKSQTDEELTKLNDEELLLTEYCLKVNPKSYCAWHQREWVLTSRTDPDWNTELLLCNKYLQFDARNFHTWDYRRFVVHHCKPSLKDEFDFTTTKLYENFSNYSAWHYRSKMLLELYPDIKGGRPIEDSHHKHELKMVQSAAFTDPDDTSAWFYQRWLLGAVKTMTQPVIAVITTNKATIAFNTNVSCEHIKSKIKIHINNNNLTGDWISSTRTDFDNLWVLKHDAVIEENLNVMVTYMENEVNIKSICVEKSPTMYIGKFEISFKKQYSEAVVSELKDQLDSCRQLLALEPDNRWTLLTTTIFLYCIDPTLYHKEVIDNLKTLKKLDKLRVGYYNDLLTNWSMERQICEDYKRNVLEFKPDFGEKMTSLTHLQYYSHCENVDLSGQHLNSNILPSLVKLHHCKKLDLANNNIQTLRGFPLLSHLEEINLRGNENISNHELEKFKENYTYRVIL